MRGAGRSLLCAVAAAAALASPAGATTSGGYRDTSYGALAMTNERAFVPFSDAYGGERGAPPQSTYGIRSVSAAFGAQLSLPGYPALATNATSAVAAWGESDGVHTAAVMPQADAVAAGSVSPGTGPGWPPVLAV